MRHNGVLGVLRRFDTVDSNSDIKLGHFGLWQDTHLNTQPDLEHNSDSTLALIEAARDRAISFITQQSLWFR